MGDTESLGGEDEAGRDTRSTVGAQGLSPVRVANSLARGSNRPSAGNGIAPTDGDPTAMSYSLRPTAIPQPVFHSLALHASKSDRIPSVSMNPPRLSSELLAEFLGTLVLILFGNGVVAMV